MEAESAPCFPRSSDLTLIRHNPRSSQIATTDLISLQPQVDPTFPVSPPGAAYHLMSLQSCLIVAQHATLLWLYCISNAICHVANSVRPFPHPKHKAQYVLQKNTECTNYFNISKKRDFKHQQRRKEEKREASQLRSKRPFPAPLVPTGSVDHTPRGIEPLQLRNAATHSSCQVEHYK